MKVEELKRYEQLRRIMNMSDAIKQLASEIRSESADIVKLKITLTSDVVLRSYNRVLLPSDKDVIILRNDDKNTTKTLETSEVLQIEVNA
jgi:hypothetical protein